MSSKVTDTIKQDLKYQIQTFQDLPFRLTLGAIADYYTVSLTPVRQVVDELIEEEVILRKSNGRLKRAKLPDGSQLQSQTQPLPKPVNLKSDLDELVTSYVVQLSLKNYSDYLREEATAQKYNTGRTIMRQVFSRLAGVGFLEHVPRCGWKVRTIREKDMSDYLEIREILEIKALKLARPFLVKHELQAILDGNIANEDPRLAELDNNLHNYWINRCDNWYIKDFFNRHGAFYTAVFEHASLGEHIISEMAQEHRDVLESLIAEDWDEAERALVKHIRDQKPNVLSMVRTRLS